MSLMIDEPGRLDLTARQGDTFRKVLTFSGTGLAVSDFTGFEARMDIVDPDDNDIILKSLTTSNGGIIMGNTDLKVTLFISDADTESATWTLGEYDLELVDAPGTGDVATFLEGDFCITPEKTKTATP